MKRDNSYYGNWRQNTFGEVWNSSTDFWNEYAELGFPSVIAEDKKALMFLALYGKFRNSVFAPSDLNRAKIQLFTLVWSKGPKWQKEVEIQGKLQSLTDEDLAIGDRRINNMASNPSVQPATGTLDELDYINGQSVLGYKKGAVEKYVGVLALLNDNITDSFLANFQPLFLVIVSPELPLWYSNYGMIEDNDNILEVE